MLGGGTFTTMNKVLSGAYINYVSAKKAQAQLSERGTAALPIPLNWGANDVVRVESDSFEKNCITIFGYPFDAPEVKVFREFFKHGKTLLVYNLNNGTKATSTISSAKYVGTRGNDIKHVVAKNVDDTDKFDVSTYIGTYLADKQTVSTAADLKDNDFVTFKADAELEVSAGLTFSGGTNGTVTGTDHQKALNTFESCAFNTLGCMSNDDITKSLYASYTKRMRDENGIKFQLIAYNLKADYIGVINLKNKVNDADTEEFALIPWVLGAEAGCEVNKTCENMTYDGEYDVDVPTEQSELKKAITAGEFVFHKNGEDVCVLSDINSFTSVSNEMNEDFQLNQVIRVLDETALQQAAIFNKKYLGKIQNNPSGRISFWGDCVDVCKELQKINALEEFEPDDVTVEKGNGKRDVILKTALMPACAMSKLYSTIYVS